MKPEPIELRGTGRTTRQMLAAPIGALFVSCHVGALDYDRRLARKHGREDLKIVPFSYINGRRYMGLKLYSVVVDHAARLSKEEFRCLEIALTHERRAP